MQYGRYVLVSESCRDLTNCSWESRSGGKVFGFNVEAHTGAQMNSFPLFLRLSEHAGLNFWMSLREHET